MSAVQSPISLVLPGSAAPGPPNDAPTGIGAVAGKVQQLLRRLPPTLIVTLLGIALTAWLLPAFTRQWDDRQKAHELKAGLVADMSSATAHALLMGKDAHRTASERRNDWLLASAAVDARLRAYFPASVVAAWETYSYFVDQVVGVNHDHANARLTRAVDWIYANPDGSAGWEPSRRLDPQIGGQAKIALVLLGNHERKTKAPPSASNARKWLATALTSYRGTPAQEQQLAHLVATRDDAGLDVQLMDFEEILATTALKSHLDGYSTSAHDFFHDLVP